MMTGIILFVVAFFLVFASAYLITSMIAEDKNPLGLIYVPVLAFSQIVLILEILSLFSLIKMPWIFLFHVIIFAVCVFVWNKKSRPLWTLEVRGFWNRFKNALKQDKCLSVLAFCFCIFILTSVFLSFIMPVTSGDAKTYHVARSYFFLTQGSLNHFVITDMRALCLPINSELIYTWIIAFLKKDVFFGYVSFVGYLISIISLFNIAGLMKFSYKRRLWMIFILSSFSSVIVQASSTETDIIIAGLILSSIYMFWSGVKSGKNIPIYMAALAYALAIGTKTPAIILIPGVGLFMLFLCKHYKNFKPLFWFLGFGVLNFLIFSSYNYILNYIDYGNISGPDSFMVGHKNYDGIKGMFANIIKYFFMMFDFTGFKWADYAKDYLLDVRNSILTLIGHEVLVDGIYTTDSHFQRSLIEHLMGAGILGFIVYLPCLVWSFIKCKLSFKNVNVRFLAGFASIFVVSILVISYLLVYMTYSVRFVMSFMVVSSPILAYSYLSKKNPLKYVIVLFSIYYLAFVSTNIWARPLTKISKILIKHPSISYIRDVAVCKTYDEYEEDSEREECMLQKHLLKYPKGTKILYLPGDFTNFIFLKKLELDGYNFDYGEVERLSFPTETDFNKYDLIIAKTDGQRSTVLRDYEKRKNDFLIDEKTKTIIIVEEREIPCIYEYNPKLSKYDKNGDMRTPLASRCYLPNQLVLDKGYKISRIVGLKKNSLVQNYYIFYQNISREKRK